MGEQNQYADETCTTRNISKIIGKKTAKRKPPYDSMVASCPVAPAINSGAYCVTTKAVQTAWGRRTNDRA